MYNREFPVGNALFFFAGGMMSLFRLPCGKLPLPFLAVPVGKDGWVECPCQTVDIYEKVFYADVQTLAAIIRCHGT